MIDLAPSLSLPSGTTLREYVQDLRAAGVRIYPGSGGAYWAASSDRVAWRLPTLHVSAPTDSEVDCALRATGALVASYVTEPDEQHGGNGWLYLCSRQDYSLRMLAPAMQRNVRRALRDLSIAPLTPRELLAHGHSAFCDTRRRNGLDDGTATGFRRHFAYRGRIDDSGRIYLGAWRHGQLAAFLTLLHVDDWVELGCFSMDSMLPHRPNDGLLYVALSHYLVNQNARVVSFGLSSIQADTKAAGLHRFKRKVGFSPHRVRRAFVLYPSLRAFANRATLTTAHWTVNEALRLQPRHRRLKELGGMLACMLGATSMPATEGDDDGAGRSRLLWQDGPLCTTSTR
jgi:hypothetical protein